MGKKFNELAELRDRSRQLMDENRRLRLALKAHKKIKFTPSQLIL